MSLMYCPKCGREVELEGDARYCRYCGLALSETRDELRGYAEVRREGYKFINVSFVLAAILFWIQYFNLIPWASFWGGNLLLILIFGFMFGLWFMGNWVVDKPAKYVKSRNGERSELTAAETKAFPVGSSGRNDEPIPIGDLRVKKTAEMVERPSVTDNTTKELPQ